MSPHAQFDALAVPAHLSERLDGAALVEVHLFAYLACLLTLYRGRPASDWGYSFAATRAGHPFSADLNEALDLLVSRGMLSDQDGRENPVPIVRLTDRGRVEFEALRNLHTLRDRDIFIRGATDSLLALPAGTVRAALAHGVDLRGVQTLGQKRLLLTERSQGPIYSEFEVLSRVVQSTSDLMVPSVLWLTYLADRAKGYHASPAVTSGAHG